MTVLSRIITPHDSMRPTYVRNPHEGAILCDDHLRQIDVDPTTEEITAEQAAFWGYRCLMCGVEPSPGRRCENEDCRQPLHPQWPAIYCSNRCALEDV